VNDVAERADIVHVALVSMLGVLKTLFSEVFFFGFRPSFGL
jgi:hypothetical protein